MDAALTRLLESTRSAIGTDGDADALATVCRLLTVRSNADDALAAAVDRARADGATWQSVGDTLGTTRQAAFQRFGHPIDPRTGDPMNTTPLPGAADKAIAVFGLLADAQWEPARVDFDQRMREQLTTQALADAWAQVTGAVGTYESAGEPVVRTMAEVTVVDLPMHFEAGDLVGRLSLDAKGAVAGLFLLTPDAAAQL